MRWYQTALGTYLRCEREVCFCRSLLNGARRQWWRSNLLAIRCRKLIRSVRFDRRLVGQLTTRELSGQYFIPAFRTIFNHELAA